MLPCIVIDFFLNNQPDALIIQIYSVIKLHVVADVEAPGGEKWERLKSGGKQWQATPKNLPRMQRTRAIPVA